MARLRELIVGPQTGELRQLEARRAELERRIVSLEARFARGVERLEELRRSEDELVQRLGGVRAELGRELETARTQLAEENAALAARADEQARENARELEEVREQLEGVKVRAGDVGEVLPEAILVRSQRDERLAHSLAPTIETAIDRSVRKNPKALAGAIFPIIGPAIRKSIKSSLESIVENLNVALEHSFSPRGLRWRLEAWRTGQSFAEIVLRHSLVYRVEQVFLVHGEEGLLLAHAVAPSVDAEDGDMVSGMLSALEDFVRDSFQGEEAAGSTSLERVEVRGVTLLLAKGPMATVAAVVRGTAPTSLANTLQSVCEDVHRELSRQLKAFDGDTAPFAVAEPHLERCISEELRDGAPGTERKKSMVLPVVATVVLGGAILLGIRQLLLSRAFDKAWGGVVAALEREPGFVIIDADAEHKLVRGLRDPDARAAAAVLAEEPLATPLEGKLELAFEPYIALDPEVVLERARRRLDPPDGVVLGLRDGELTAVGEAPHAWVARARGAATGIDGIDAFDGDGLVDTDLAALERAAARLETMAVRFDVGRAEPDVAALERVAAELDTLGARALAAGRTAVVRTTCELTSFERENDGPALAAERGRELRGTLGEVAGVQVLHEVPTVDAPGESAARITFLVELREGAGR